MKHEKRDCLLILPRIPYPPVGGDKLKNFFLIDILSRNFLLHIVIISNERMTEKAKAFLDDRTASYKHFYYPSYRFLFNASASLLNRNPLQVNYYYFNKVQHYIDNRFNDVDFVICNLIRTAKYVSGFGKEKKYLDIVDSIALNYERSLNTVTSYFWKLIYRMEVKRLTRFEKECISNFNITFFVNRNEATYWKCHGNTCWIPNGVSNAVLDKGELISQQSPLRKAIAFFGKMDYQPNIDAVVWFCQHVLLNLNKDIDFLIIGFNPDSKVRQLASTYPNVKVFGYQDDPYVLLKSCLAVVAPMQSGGGIQNKILECMGLGQLVITSSLGGEPIVGAVSQIHLIIEDEPQKIAELINAMGEDETIYDAIKANARTLIMENYTWAIYEEKLLTILT